MAIVSRYPQTGRFVSAAEAVEAPSGAGCTQPSRHAAADSLWLVRSGPARESIRRRMLLCSPSASVGEAARMMARHRAEVVAVTDPEGRPLGAVTVAALRDRVATGEVSLEAPCRAIMHSGFPMLAPGFDTGAALLAMTRGRTCFAGITVNGAGDSPLQGIVTDRDLELYRGINPPFLLREILDAREATDLARARKQIEVMLADGMTETPAVDGSASVSASYTRRFWKGLSISADPNRTTGLAARRLNQARRSRPAGSSSVLPDGASSWLQSFRR